MRWTEDEYDDYLRRTGQRIPQRHYESLYPLRDIIEKQMAEQHNEKVRMRKAQPGPQFKSKTERRAWEEWVPTSGCEEAYYEPIRLYLNSGSYRPDFALRMPDGELWIIEVKGSWNAYQSGRSSKKSLKEAAKMYWWLARFFSLLPKKGGGWELEEIK